MTNPDTLRRSWLAQLLKFVGVALASALFTAFCVVGALFLFNDLGGFLFGLLFGVAVSTASFWSRGWIAVPSAFAGAFLAAVPLISSTGEGRHSRRAEAEQMLGGIKGQVRVVYAKQGHAGNIRTLTGAPEAGGCGFSPAELEGKYFRIRDQVVLTETGAILYADPTALAKDKGVCACAFNWQGGDGVFTWDP